MHQLTIYASPDLESRVVSALADARIERYLSLGSATAHRFNDRDDLPRTTDWEARVYVVPAAELGSIQAVVEALHAHAEATDTDPCLKMIVSAIESVH